MFVYERKGEYKLQLSYRLDIAGWLYLGEEGRRCVAVASKRFMQLLQFDQHRFLVLVFPQRAISDQPIVMVQRAAVAGGVQPAVLFYLLGFG